jgi:hypothetical protein
MHMYAERLDNVNSSMFFISFLHLYKDKVTKNNYITQLD